MKKLSLILGMTLMATLAYAQEESSSAAASSNTTTVEKSQVVPKDAQNKDIDDEITNARLRAATGSKSKFSFRSSLSYNGGSIEKPFDKIRPNYRASANTLTSTRLGGSIGAKYRATERDNFSLTTGVSIITPFHNKASELGDKTTVSGLSLSYERLYKMGDIQMVSDAGLSVTTDRESIDMYNDLGGWSLGQSAVFPSFYGWDFGLAVSIGGSVYGDSSKFAPNGEERVSYGLGLYPTAEYAFSESVQFRTVFGYFNYVAMATAPGTWISEDPYQSMGLGFVVTRDIYLYPNIQFVPTDVRADRTNVAVSTYISL